MQPIYENAFRHLGLEANAKLKDIKKNSSLLFQYANVGQEKKMAYDVPFLGGIERSKKSVEQASSALNFEESKLLESFFWFINHTEIDNEALSFIQDDNYDKAYRLLEAKVSENALSIDTVSLYNNFSTLQLLNAEMHIYKEAIATKIQLASEKLWLDQFILTIGDYKKPVDKREIQLKVANYIMKGLKQEFPHEKYSMLLYFFSKCPKDFVEKIVESLCQGIANDLKYLCEDYDKSKDNSISSVESLIVNGKSLADQLLEYENHAGKVNDSFLDQFSSVLRNNGIVAYNEHKGSFSDKQQEVLVLANGIALSLAKSKLNYDWARKHRDSLKRKFPSKME